MSYVFTLDDHFPTGRVCHCLISRKTMVFDFTHVWELVCVILCHEASCTLHRWVQSTLRAEDPWGMWRVRGSGDVLSWSWIVAVMLCTYIATWKPYAVQINIRLSKDQFQGSAGQNDALSSTELMSILNNSDNSRVLLARKIPTLDPVATAMINSYWIPRRRLIIWKSKR